MVSRNATYRAPSGPPPPGWVSLLNPSSPITVRSSRRLQNPAVTLAGFEPLLLTLLVLRGDSVVVGHQIDIAPAFETMRVTNVARFRPGGGRNRAVVGRS